MILIVGNFLSASRSTRSVCEELAERLVGGGLKVVTTSTYGMRLLRLLDMMGTAWSRRGEYKVALVEVYSGSAFVWAEMICWTLRRVGKPYVLALHGGNLPVFAKGREERVGRLLRKAKRVVAPSRYLLENMRPYRNDMLLIPNALETTRYAFRRRETPRPRLVWLRAFHSIYNPTLAPRVVAELAGEFPDLELQMIGPDNADGSLEETRETAKRLGVFERIRFAGSIPKLEVSAKLNEGDIFINTTNIDNTPVSVMEALACGLCVVSTSVGGIPYLLADEQDALLVPPDDPQAMANAVRRILSEPGISSRLSQSGRSKALTFDWTVVLPQWKSLLSEVAATL